MRKRSCIGAASSLLKTGLDAVQEDFCIGRTSRHEYFEGEIAHVRIYDYWLSPSNDVHATSAGAGDNVATTNNSSENNTSATYCSRTNCWSSIVYTYSFEHLGVGCCAETMTNPALYRDYYVPGSVGRKNPCQKRCEAMEGAGAGVSPYKCGFGSAVWADSSWCEIRSTKGKSCGEELLSSCNMGAGGNNSTGNYFDCLRRYRSVISAIGSAIGVSGPSPVWTRLPSFGVHLDGTTAKKPVVILGAVSAFDPAPVLAEVACPLGRGSSPTCSGAFDYREGVLIRLMQPLDCGYDGEHLEETTAFFAQLPGVHQTDQGLGYEVGLLETGFGPELLFREHTFQTPIPNPVVFLTTQDRSFYRDRWLVLRLHDVFDNGFKFAWQNAKNYDIFHNNTRAGDRWEKEKVGYLAMPSGSGTINGRRYVAGATGYEVSEEWRRVREGREVFADILELGEYPVLFAFLQTTRGPDPTVVRVGQEVADYTDKTCRKHNFQTV